jgi:hypothetical protein
VGAVGQIVALAAAVHRPIVGRLRHVGEHRGIDVVRKDAVEDEVIERRLVAGAASIAPATNARNRSTASLRPPAVISTDWSTRKSR